jgi:DNA-directed RNA polymerase subunit L
MPVLYLLDEGHTLAAALRPALEAACPDEFAAVTQPHPLDRHLEVTAPAEGSVRDALLAVRAQVATAAAAIRS